MLIATDKTNQEKTVESAENEQYNTTVLVPLPFDIEQNSHINLVF